ncbi:hypothetical protein, variant [Puccinia triticina 1-1 BBBD Race 1]|uniref:Uncharacterized protein n=1 Tax=Puccinia triticina (isolate 1-1 / race 1 (BBBD)) TaxID=630390 RepID=A0A180GX20_PUCT1|nr:hypothetical protein PTTG_07501 [Puccinia triticina 1-1 BBBD Race 1]OAV96898.1 hypothetical protein, variant [Puccinia triticina 1-1 BBBD Race 1]
MAPSTHAGSNPAGLPRSKPSGSSFATEKLKPLTQLSSPSESLFRTDIAGHHVDKSVSGPNLTQSDHSRRGSMSSQSQHGPNAPHAHVNNLHGLPTTQTSMPKLTLGNRLSHTEGGDQKQARSSGPHPYDLILPGEETLKIPPVRTRAMSVATAPAASIASVNRSKSFRIGARRFTQTAHASVHFGPNTGTTTKASLHGRRYSTIAREPSAAATPEGSSNAGDVFEEDDHVRDAKKIAKHDTQMLLVSFNSLLGRDGGGKAVEKLIAFVLQGGLGQALEEITGLVKQVLQGVPTLQAAYVSVYMHEITDQIQKIGGLLFLEPELLSMFDSLYSRFRGLAGSNSSGSPILSLSNLWEFLVDKFTNSPVYQSALLKLIETFSKLVLSSEMLRDGLWTTLSRVFSQSARSQVDPATANLAACLGLLFAGVEQLTGCSIGPLVKYFISWLAIVDDLLTKLAKETSDVLNQPLRLPNVPPTDYATHPFGYIYSPTESSAKLDVVIRKWLAVFGEDPVHKKAFEHFKRCFDNVISGITGNSTFARFSRDLVRVWRGIMGHPSEGVQGTGLEGGLECFKSLASKFIEIPVQNVITRHKGFELTLSDFKLSLMDVLPLEISFSTHSRLFPSNCSFQNSTRLELKDLQLGLKNACAVQLKDGTSGSTSRSTAIIHTKLNLSIDFIPPGNKLPKMLTSLPYYGGSVAKVSTSDIKLSGATDVKVPDTLWPEVKDQMHQTIETTVQDYVDSFFKTWLALQPKTSKDLPVAMPKPAGAKSAKSVPNYSHKLLETHGNARDRFKASIRNLTGIKTGAVLTQLQNPLSGSGSPLASPSTEEAPGSKFKRRQSMADYLTDISKADSTLPENIQRPPVAESQRRNNSANLPNVFDEDEEDAPPEFETMARSLSFSARGDSTSVDRIIRPLVSSKADVNSVFSHRGAMSNFPMVEISYEAYQRAEASLDEKSNTPTMEIGGQEVPSMAQSLSELATRDTTTEEAIANPPTVDGSRRKQSYAEPAGNLTMDQITRHLSGLTDRPVQDADVTPEQRILRRNAVPPELPSKMLMADVLTDSVKEDNTLPETQATGHLSGPVNAAGVPLGDSVTSLSQSEIVAMRNKLSKLAATDMTLPSNIALPPGTQHVYRGTPSNAYTGLKVLRSMSTTLNEAIEKDYTTPEGQAELYRTTQSPANQIVGLTEKEMKQRRQSFKLSEEAMRDMTLIESIRNPPTVAQSIPPV